MDSTSPRRGEKVSYYSAVCLETGEVTGTGGQQQLGHFGCATTAGATPSVDRDLGHSAIGATRCERHARLEPAWPPGEPAQLQPRLQRSRPSGAGRVRRRPPTFAWAPVPQSREGGQLFRKPVQPSGGSKAPLPDRVASKSGTTDWPLPSRYPPPSKCRFHLGFSLAPPSCDPLIAQNPELCRTGMADGRCSPDIHQPTLRYTHPCG